MTIIIIGLGSIARKHIAAIRKIKPQARLFALRSNSHAEQVEGIINIFTQEEVKQLKADFAIVSNPTSEHIPTLEWLTALRIPLFIEKPLSDNLNMGKVMSKCEGILTYVACNLRFLECLIWVKANLREKRINEVNAYCGSYLPDWRANTNWRTCYSANRTMGGGVHIDLIHEVDYLYWLLGKPQTVRKIFRNCSSLAIDAVDYANYCMIYSNFVASVTLNYYRRDSKRTLEILFEDETWEVDLRTNQVRQAGGEILFQRNSEVVDTYVQQMEYFINLVTCKAIESMNPITEAYDVLNIALGDEPGE